MKKLQLLLATLVCSLVFVSAASASLVQFWAYDELGSAGDGTVKLSITNISGFTLDYSTNGINWLSTLGGIAITGEKSSVQLRLNTPTPTLTGHLSFLGAPGSDFYNGALVYWDGLGDMSFTVTVDNDKISNKDINVAPVPVPPAAYLLASGVIGIITLRRRKVADLA